MRTSTHRAQAATVAICGVTSEWMAKRPREMRVVVIVGLLLGFGRPGWRPLVRRMPLARWWR